MDVLTRFLLVLCIPLLTGCQVGYVISSGWNQSRLYSKRVDIHKVIADPNTKPEVKRKLELVLEAREFAEKDLGLTSTKNYTTFVQLDRPYVSYIVHAAPAFELKSYRWWFPIIGHVPYKGYFNKKAADEEAQDFDKEKYDTYVRGVTAYSTLGWFDDPVWSSMMTYSDQDLVNTIIHETVHATVFIKSQADFNERLATFLGDFGTELFYRKKEGEKAKTLEIIAKEQADQKLFSEFVTREMADLRKWYASLNGQRPVEEKKQKMAMIQTRFKTEVIPKLQAGGYTSFGQDTLNNARLLSIGTYFEDLSDFVRLREKLGGDFKTVLAYLKNLAQSKNPEKDLKAFASGT